MQQAKIQTSCIMSIAADAHTYIYTHTCIYTSVLCYIGCLHINTYIYIDRKKTAKKTIIALLLQQ